MPPFDYKTIPCPNIKVFFEVHPALHALYTELNALRADLENFELGSGKYFNLCGIINFHSRWFRLRFHSQNVINFTL